MNDLDYMIEVDRVVRQFRHKTAIDSVTLKIWQGELFGVVGPDGAGKSTLLRMMAAVLNPTGGVIRIDGYDTRADSEQIKAIMGYMPQQFGLYSDLSVAENMHFTADVYGIRGHTLRDRLERLYAFSGLATFKTRPAGRLSGGMKKKLVLASALIHEPTLMLLDEPTTGVDPVARRTFWDLLSGLHAQGTTTVVSTPYMDEAERCNRVALLHEGRVLACDTPAAIKARVPGEVLALVSANNRAAADVLHDIDGLLGLQTYGDRLNVIVKERNVARSAIQKRLEVANIQIESLQDAPVRMEEAFIWLIKREPRR